MVLWTSGARWEYMHAYERPLQKACFAVGRETGARLAERPRAVAAYAGGIVPALNKDRKSTATNECKKIGLR